MKLKIFPDIETLNLFAAEKFIEIANEAIEKRGKFTVALAGGSTPKAIYKILKTKNLEWEKVFFFLGDERNVMPSDKESNFAMARRYLFTPKKINLRENTFRWQTELKDPKFTAEIYEQNMKNFFQGFPQFDLILLGMGADGHMASLFPFTDALRETEKIAVANYVEKLNDWRFTLTFPTINNARNIIFLVADEEKAETLREVLQGNFEPERLPSQNVRPKDGNLFWLLDKNVAKLLSNDGN